MRITRVETIPVRVPIKAELAIRSGRGGSHTISPFLLVLIRTDSEVTGLGEVSCTPRWSGEDQVTAAHFIKNYFAPLLVGESVSSSDATADIARLYEKFSSAVAENFFTKAAVEMALWDIAGKAAEEPVWKLISEVVGREASARRDTVSGQSAAPELRPSRVATKWSVSGVEPAKAAGIARWAVEQGFSKMKVKVGFDPESDIARVRAVRDAVGPEVKLGVDANGGWPSVGVAVETIRRLCDRCGIYFAEQPIPPGDHEALAEVRRNVPVPIVADESIYSLADAKALARANAADVFSIYIGKAGGIGPALEIARFAQSVGIPCTIGSNLELGVGSAAMTHFACGAPGIAADEYPCDIIGPLFYEGDILAEPLPIVGGSAGVHDQAGLGVRLDRDKVAKYRAE
jgi:muconate cycloisomerase